MLINITPEETNRVTSLELGDVVSVSCAGRPIDEDFVVIITVFVLEDDPPFNIKNAVFTLRSHDAVGFLVELLEQPLEGK